MRRIGLHGFLWLAVITAIGAALLCVGVVAVLHQGAAFRRLLQVVVRHYSPDGQLSPAGVAIITRTIEILAWASGVLTVLAGVVAQCLRRILRGPRVPDGVSPRADLQRASGPSWWSPSVPVALAAVMLVLGAAVRIPGLFTSLLYDEIFSIQQFAMRPLAHIPFVQEGFNNHILNSLFLHTILRWSSAEALLRLPIFLAGMGSVWLFFQIGRRLGGSLTGLFAAWLAVTSPYHVLYSTLARGYMLGLFFTLLGVWVLMKAKQPPHPRSLWGFGLSQVLASWAMPTAAATCLVLAMCLLLAAFPLGRRLVGIDPRSPTGSAWLVTALCTVSVVGLVNVQMIPFLLRVLAEAQMLALGGALAGAASWFGIMQRGTMLAALGVGVVGLGVAALLKHARDAGDWRQRVLLVLACLTITIFLTSGYPARIQFIAFLGFVVLAAAGLHTLVVAGSRVLVHGRSVAAGTLSLLVLVAVTMSSWPELVQAARGSPRQDVRGAVRLAESLLPPEGAIVTSGFSNREIGYYATRPVRLLAPTENPAALFASTNDFCYFRLFERTDNVDPVFVYFTQQAGPPGMTVSGVDDPIAMWCFVRGAMVRWNPSDQPKEIRRGTNQSTPTPHV